MQIAGGARRSQHNLDVVSEQALSLSSGDLERKATMTADTLQLMLGNDENNMHASKVN